MINNTFLFIIIILTIIILFMCESNKGIIEGMTTFKWYDSNQVELGSRYNRCLDSVISRIKSNPNEVVPANFLQDINECADTFMIDIPPLQAALVTRFSQSAQQRVIREKQQDADIYCQVNDKRNGPGQECAGIAPGELVKGISDIQKTQKEKMTCPQTCENCTSTSLPGCGGCSDECIWRNNLIAEEAYCPSCITDVGGVCSDDCGGVTPCIPKSTSKSIYQLTIHHNKNIRDLANEYENLLCRGTTQCISKTNDETNDSNCATHNNDETACGNDTGCIYYNGMKRDTLIQKRNAMLSLTDTKIHHLQKNLRKIGAKVSDNNDVTRSDQQDNTSPAWTGVNPADDHGDDIKDKTFTRLNTEVGRVTDAGQALIDANAEKDTESTLRKNYAEKINNYRGLKALLNDERKNNIEIRYGRCGTGQTCGLPTVTNTVPDTPERRCSQTDVESGDPVNFDTCEGVVPEDPVNAYGNEDDYIKGQFNDQITGDTTRINEWETALGEDTPSPALLGQRMIERTNCIDWKDEAQGRFNKIYPVYQELLNQAPSCKNIFSDDEIKKNQYCEKDSEGVANDNYKGGADADAITCCPPPPPATGDIPNVLPTELTTEERDNFGPNCPATSESVPNACTDTQQDYIVEGRKVGIIEKKNLIGRLANNSQNQISELNQYSSLGSNIYGGANTEAKCEGNVELDQGDGPGGAGLCSDKAKMNIDDCCGDDESCRTGSAGENGNIWWIHRSGRFTAGSGECLLKDGETEPDPPCSGREQTACEGDQSNNNCNWNIISTSSGEYLSAIKNQDGGRCENITPFNSPNDRCETAAEKQLKYTNNLMNFNNKYVETCGQAILPLSTAASGVQVNCVGSWSEYGDCSESCGGGTQSRTFTVTTPASGGGTECDAANNATESQDCNQQACAATEPTVTWRTYGQGTWTTGAERDARTQPDPTQTNPASVSL